MLYTERMEKLESLKKKYKFLGTIEDIGEDMNEIESLFETDETCEKKFEELESKLKGFQNTLYGLNATNIQKRHIDNFFESVKRGEINFDTTFTIYTNRTDEKNSIVKTGLSKEEARDICLIHNNEINVPDDKIISDMIGFMWCVEE